ncbi:hypothetical protein AMS58_06230 [Pseudoalteromonas porphyrae]|uniref:response regulator n=1 Tax=Pseudoalteromonas porphyrae TaxID=187330 RepID=UPI0006BAACE2|nr:response regulator [Pseudoalteromonas porphyrae]KPH95772.1 hypothetical protein AMS58_06230 [Pseudoalteromonas porphyrae]
MNKKPVLVVDDSFANLKIVCLLLESEGYQVETAMDAEEALSVLERFLPSIILMDIQLPGMDGLTLTKKIKSNPRYKNVMVIALTAYAMKGDEERALESGCTGYITKPIDTRKFTTIIESFLEQHNSLNTQINKSE